MSLRRALAAALPVLVLAVASAPARAADVTPVPSVDLTRYTGLWHQIAAIPAPYEFFCQKDVTATYSLNPDGTVKVVNDCSGPFGIDIVANGRARSLDATGANLQVSFFEFFGQWVYFGGTTPNYQILGVAPDYSWVVTGEASRVSGFVLARGSSLSAADVATTREILVKNGYDPCKLQVTVQTGGEPLAKPYC